ncbi:MAG TPA: SemiSWEET transporter [Terriglobales bacterium]|nr:SemiSWEET transporter [Terriglobales bacterium]
MLCYSVPVSTEIPTYVTTIGFAAGTLTTISFVPQLLKTWRTRQTRDMSGSWLASFIGGLSLWLTYGLLNPSMPIIVANTAKLLLTLPILVLKIHHREQK